MYKAYNKTGVICLDLKEISRIAEAKIVTGNDKLAKEIHNACGADLMSDVLACQTNSYTLLITSLANIQVVRTADILGLAAILFVRGKRPLDSNIELAKEAGIPLLVTPYDMYEICGRLYSVGLKGSSKC